MSAQKNEAVAGPWAAIEGKAVTRAIRIAIADDYTLFVDSLEQLLRAERDMKVIWRAADGEEALAMALRQPPDVLLLDLRMPRMDGLTVLKKLRTAGSGTRVVLVNGTIEDDQMLEALRLGAEGVILKTMNARLLLQCIRRVHAGEQWIEKDATFSVVRRLLQEEKSASTLTPREREVVRLVARGLRNREIAQRLSIAESTVKLHVHSALSKLNLQSRVALTLYARNAGLT
jgi:DNA-binding NarL/FixJ family response regulator